MITHEQAEFINEQAIEGILAGVEKLLFFVDAGGQGRLISFVVDVGGQGRLISFVVDVGGEIIVFC